MLRDRQRHRTIPVDLCTGQQVSGSISRHVSRICLRPEVHGLPGSPSCLWPGCCCLGTPRQQCRFNFCQKGGDSLTPDQDENPCCQRLNSLSEPRISAFAGRTEAAQPAIRSSTKSTEYQSGDSDRSLLGGTNCLALAGQNWISIA